MNWLAHIFVSTDSIEYQLGNLLADPLKGKLWRGASRHVREGFSMHRSIDSFTDANRHVHRSKARLRTRGYLKGVVVDIAYDNLLLKRWNQYSHVTADEFINNFFTNADAVLPELPQDARVFVQQLKASKALNRYATFEGLEQAFAQMDKRLPRRILARETTSSYLPALKQEIGAMEDDFARFFPQLIAHFKNSSNTDLDGHWIKWNTV